MVGELPENNLVVIDGSNDIGKNIVGGTAVTGFTLALANDGINFSDKHLFLIYDGKCLECDTSSKNKLCNRKVYDCLMFYILPRFVKFATIRAG